MLQVIQHYLKSLEKLYELKHTLRFFLSIKKEQENIRTHTLHQWEADQESHIASEERLINLEIKRLSVSLEKWTTVSGFPGKHSHANNPTNTPTLGTEENEAPHLQ